MSETATRRRPSPARPPVRPLLCRDALDATARAAFPARPFLVRHTLVGDPRVSTEGILALIERLPARHADWHPGDVSLDHVGRPPKPPLDPRQLLIEIETAGAWLGIDKAHADPAYAQLAAAWLDEVRAAFPDRVDGLHDPEVYLFVSSPGARKPIHMDPEHNFLLQVKGSKTVHLWDVADRDLVPETLLEAFATTTDWAGLPVERGDRAPTHSFVLEPGQGLYFPVHWPHAVQNGPDEACTSISLTFRSAGSRRAETVRQFNAKLRRWGVSPTPPGLRPRRDAWKAAAMGLARAAKTLRPRRQAPR